jgi:hypothetical protein
MDAEHGLFRGILRLSVHLEEEVMLDYAAWVGRLSAFVAQLPHCGQTVESVECTIRPPLDPATAPALLAGIPDALAAFYRQGAAKLLLEYTVRVVSPSAEDEEEELTASAYLGGPKDVANWLEECREWATDTWIAECEDACDYWTHAVPFLCIGNGDYIGIYTGDAVPAGTVVYLSHDDMSFELAPSFEAFLTTWEQLCYLGPESWVLEPFLSAETGYLDGTGEAAARVRQALRP